MPSPGALSHLRVIDLTRVRAGPTCVKQFADWGADVIKVEMPVSEGEDGFGPREGSDFQNLHRNKRSITLNLKDARGVEVTHTVVIRHRTGVFPGDRFLYRGRHLDVLGAEDISGRRKYLACRCTERRVTG